MLVAMSRKARLGSRGGPGAELVTGRGGSWPVASTCRALRSASDIRSAAATWSTMAAGGIPSPRSKAA
jgi:hypothetical protein